MTIKEWLDSLKVGDQVVRVSHGFGGTRILQTIEKISGTKRRVITLRGGERFNGATGRRQEDAGGRYRMGCVSPRIEEATPEFKADQEKKQRINKARLEFENVSDAIEHVEDHATIKAAVIALKAILHPLPSPPPQLISRDDLAAAWNEDADHFNRWDSLSDEEQLEWAQARAIAQDRARRQGEAD
jgi:hypothetical protein